MRTGRPKQPLIVTHDERQRLESLAHRARSQSLLARRARVVLGCAEGLDNKAVAKKLRCSLGMVGKWRSRFLEARLEGLYDEPRPGAPRQISDATVAACGLTPGFGSSRRHRTPPLSSIHSVWDVPASKLASER